MKEKKSIIHVKGTAITILSKTRRMNAASFVKHEISSLKTWQD